MKRKIKKDGKIKRLVGYVLLFMVIGGLMISIVPASAYICKDGDVECEEAKANMEAKQNEANAFSRKASSVTEIIEKLNADIEAINAAIAEIESEIKVLNVEIKQTEKKLKETQVALAEMLINIHFSDDSEPIRVLAGSRSISDYAEKAAREEVAKQEVATMSEKIKATKEKLDQKKSEVEAKKEANEQGKQALAAKKESQASLRALYEKNADDATRIAAEWEEKVRAKAWVPPSNTVGFGSRWWDGPADTYGERDRCWSGMDYSTNWVFPYGGLVCQCTDYVSWKTGERFGIWNDWYGDAWEYIYAPNRTQYYRGRIWVDNIPMPNSIAVWPTVNPAIDPGHVAWVESINGDGSINVTEYNVSYPAWGCYEKDFCSRKGVGSSGVMFVHFR